MIFASANSQKLQAKWRKMQAVRAFDTDYGWGTMPDSRQSHKIKVALFNEIYIACGYTNLRKRD